MISLSLSFFLGVDEAGEAVDVAAEAGAIVEQTVKPSEMGIDEFYDILRWQG